jgi:hypothetical protein
MPRPKKKADSKLYSVTIEMSGESFTVETDDIQEALLAFKPGKMTTKAVITVEYGEKKTEDYMFPARARRVFNHPMTAFVFARNLTRRLHG